jgi:hypothetical protein
MDKLRWQRVILLHMVARKIDLRLQLLQPLQRNHVSNSHYLSWIW